MDLVESVSLMGLSSADRMVGGLMPLVQRSAEPPSRIVGRLMGLGAGEQAANIPKWAWFGVGVIAGATVVWVWGDAIKKAVGRK